MRRLFGYLAVAALALISSNGLAQTAPFRVTGNTTLAVTTATANVAFASIAPTALIINTGTNAAYLKFGGSGITAAITDYLLGPGCSVAYDVNGQGYVAAITVSSTTTLSVLTGAGAPSLPPSGCGTSSTGTITTTNKPSTGTGAYASATAGVADSTVSASPVYFLDIVNTSSTATVCVNLGAIATITGTACAAGEITLPPLWHRSWEDNFVPTDAIHVIASAASTPLAVGAK
jgi:hypothetical protein